MKTTLQIPAGYRQLKKGEVIQQGDKYNSGGSWEFCASTVNQIFGINDDFTKGNDTGTILIRPHNQTESDITLRFRMFQVHYVPPGNVRGSRIKIKDLRHNKTKFIGYSSDGGRTFDQAIKYLESKGIFVDGMGLAYKDSDCVLLSKDIATPLK